MFATALFLTVLVGCQSPEQRAQAEAERAAALDSKISAAEAAIPGDFNRLTGDSLKNYAADTTVSGDSATSPGWKYIVYRDTDGAQRGTSTDGTKTSKDSGQWWIDGGSLCSKWKNWRDGRTSCSRIYANDAGAVFWIDSAGEVNEGAKYNTRHAQGNTQGL